MKTDEADRLEALVRIVNDASRVVNQLSAYGSRRAGDLHSALHRARSEAAMEAIAILSRYRIEGEE